jgi:hypothetical protein
MLDKLLIQVDPIGQDHVSKGALVLVVAVRLDRDFLSRRLVEMPPA